MKEAKKSKKIFLGVVAVAIAAISGCDDALNSTRFLKTPFLIALRIVFNSEKAA